MLPIIFCFFNLFSLSKGDACDSAPCVGGSTCLTIRTGYTCSCMSGFTYSTTLGCLDIDECVKTNCSDNQKCFNHPGSYECTCVTGYAFNFSLEECQDIDECLKTPCEEDRVCHNVNGTFDCLCQEGYFEYEEGSGCSDVDECNLYDALCNETSCVNTVGSYYCKCRFGMVLTSDGECGNVPQGPPNIFVLWLLLCLVIVFAFSRIAKK